MWKFLMQRTSQTERREGQEELSLDLQLTFDFTT